MSHIVDARQGPSRRLQMGRPRRRLRPRGRRLWRRPWERFGWRDGLAARPGDELARPLRALHRCGWGAKRFHGPVTPTARPQLKTGHDSSPLSPDVGGARPPPPQVLREAAMLAREKRGAQVSATVTFDAGHNTSSCRFIVRQSPSTTLAVEFSRENPLLAHK